MFGCQHVVIYTPWHGSGIFIKLVRNVPSVITVYYSFPLAIDDDSSTKKTYKKYMIFLIFVFTMHHNESVFMSFSFDLRSSNPELS